MRFILFFLFFIFFTPCFADSQTRIDSGYIYVVSNPKYKRGVYKIGMTRNVAPYQRVKQLYNTSVPVPFEVKLLIASDSVLAHEKRIHKKLAKYRIDSRREFFECSLRVIKKAIKE